MIPIRILDKLLNALKQIDFEHFDGIIEIDETYFLYSQKGQRGITERKPRKRGGKSKHRGISHEQVCILVARDRKNRCVILIQRDRRIKSLNDKRMKSNDK